MRQHIRLKLIVRKPPNSERVRSAVARDVLFARTLCETEARARARPTERLSFGVAAPQMQVLIRFATCYLCIYLSPFGPNLSRKQGVPQKHHHYQRQHHHRVIITNIYCICCSFISANGNICRCRCCRRQQPQHCRRHNKEHAHQEA